MNKPAVLLADEPTGNLDPTTSAGIMALLERINAGGTTVIMATHEAGIVDQMKRRVIELSAGSIVRDESQGGYGQTESITVVHDGVVVVAADDHKVAETTSIPVITESALAPAEVPQVDLRRSAPPLPTAADPHGESFTRPRVSQTAAQPVVPEGRRSAAAPRPTSPPRTPSSPRPHRRRPPPRASSSSRARPARSTCPPTPARSRRSRSRPAWDCAPRGRTATRPETTSRT